MSGRRLHVDENWAELLAVNSRRPLPLTLVRDSARFSTIVSHRMTTVLDSRFGFNSRSNVSSLAFKGEGVLRIPRSFEHHLEV